MLVVGCDKNNYTLPLYCNYMISGVIPSSPAEFVNFFVRIINWLRYAGLY